MCLKLFKQGKTSKTTRTVLRFENTKTAQEHIFTLHELLAANMDDVKFAVTFMTAYCAGR